MKKVSSLLLRYALIILAGLGNLFIVYAICGPLTFYLASLILPLFGAVSSFQTLHLIIFNTTTIYLINACVAGSAYYLLFILNLSTPNIKFLKRIYMLAFCFGSLLLLNLIRIVLMTLIAGSKLFYSVHMLFWYVLSLVFVIAIWFLAVRIFRIKEVPVFSDVSYLIKQMNSKRKITKR